jgi:hypothetical protein
MKETEEGTMPQGLEDIRATLAQITRGDDVMDLLTEFERTLDATEIFSYRNWPIGELVKGPDVTRYWFTTSWMFPHTLMPDPDGALRLEKIGCRVTYEKDTLNQPRRILSPKDWKNPKTKDAKIDELPVWVVTIAMPIKYVTDHLDLQANYIDDQLKDDLDAIATETEAALPADDEDVDIDVNDEMGDDEGLI